ncbi:hypothetical protein [Prevotella sp. E2-28]|uniref:hypothetical protein n=1 Tax=Prevotella sp. E2-28 TaxID=2913620 RepID=UPI001EDA755F|nr:hypothetical protein [Prevotella sp. E2-28]UKK53161.1 hypothetical protein L6465_11295 [Prevotella sp. E2-28]
MRLLPIIAAACILLGCTSNNQDDNHYFLQGAWILEQQAYPMGHQATYSETEGTWLRLYEGDSVMYQCWMAKTESGLIIRPDWVCNITLIDKGGGEHIYLEDDDPHPLRQEDDSTIVTQQSGVLHTWRSANEIAEEWGDEIRNLTMVAMQKDGGASQQSYVLSAKERKQASLIHGFIFLTVFAIVLLLLITRIAIYNRKAKRTLQLQLQQIQEIQEERPQAVRKAIESVETAYFASDEYQTLQRRIATGQKLKVGDWGEIESQIRKVYPGFASQLRGLYAMSELEYQVCLLIKLRISPSDMAAVLARDASTISTVRSRLYKKVFGQKGGTREWDEFILSIGA